MNELSLHRDDGEDLVVVLVVELHQCRVVEDGEKVGLDGVRVGGLAKDLQEGRVRDKEEPEQCMKKGKSVFVFKKPIFDLAIFF